jgi:regulation of enolase protein 1 (concanavalin A-like superfamily)
MPSGAWQATTKVSLVARNAYQQAGLVLYGDDDNYAKMVLSATGTNDAASRRFQFIREERGVPNEVADSNTPQLGAAYPDTAYVRFISDGTKLTAAYSRDGAAWTSMPQTDKLLAGIPNPRIGLISLASTGNRPVVDASFDWFQLEHGAPGVDEFDSSPLDTCRWDAVVRPDPAAVRVTGGNLEIDTSRGDIFGGDNSAPKNFILQTPPAGDWTLDTKIDASAFGEAYQQGGLIAYTDDGNYVKLDHVTANQPGQPVTRRIELRSEVGDTVQNPQPEISADQGVWWLRLSKQGSTFRGYASSDGTTWTEVGTVSNTAVGTAKVGLYAFGVGQTVSKTAKFDFFHPTWGQVVDVTPPVTTAVTDPASPGPAGWFTGPVSVVLTATDDRELDRVEYAVDGGAWSRYTVPVTVAEGSHTVGYRSVDKAGNVEPARTIEVRRDGTAPSTKATFAPPGDGGWHQGSVPVTLTATDAGSGVESVEYALDGGAWTAYTEPVVITGDGTHTLLYRAKDRAGTVEADKAATVKIDSVKPTVLVSGVADGRIYGDSQDLRISWQAVDSTSGVRSIVGTLDGEVRRSGALQPLYELPLGVHRLSVTATDHAGNRTVQEVAFGVTTSSRDLANLVTRFQVTGWLSQADANALQAQLTKVRKAEANGNDAKTIAELRKFRTLAAGHAAEVSGVLVRDTDALIAVLSGPLPAVRPE